MAANTDKVRQGASGISTTLQSSISNVDVSLTPASISNIPTLTAVDITIDRVDSSGTLTPSKMERIIGVVSGGNLVSLLRGQDNTTAQSHSTGAVIEMIPTGKWSQDLATNILTQHNQDGTHGAVTATSLSTTGNVTIGGTLTIGSTSSAGWTPISGTVTAATNNGNRSYTLTTDTDNSTAISPGMRLRTTRTVAAPTQCTSLNGTTQYYSRASGSVAGMTFTDDFVAGAWVKLSSYSASAAQTIISRYNGTSGWGLTIASTGQVLFYGRNAGAANISYVQSYQSIPLNKWVHVAAQLDMSSFTATTTTSYVMIDGVDVPASVLRGGTNPTALIQAGNLEIGSANASEFFPGKIAQAFVTSAKVTQATIRSNYMSQSISPTETSLISAYSFNNSINDLNTTNANNLTANGSAVATNADSPFTQNAAGVPGGSLDYGIVTGVTSSTLTVQVPEGCTIPTSGGISAVSYSANDSPYGFPRNKGRWAIEIKYKAQLVSTLTSISAWVNVTGASFVLPLMKYEVSASMAGVILASAAAYIGCKFTISDASTTQTFDHLTGITPQISSASAQNGGQVTITGALDVTTQATYYLNAQPTVVSGTTNGVIDTSLPAVFRFIPAYL